jgi:hypothetical protein
MNAEAESKEAKARSSLWRDGLLLWLLWIPATTLGWWLGRIISGALAFSSALWDSDEVQAYLSTSPWDRLFRVLLAGAMVGVILGVVVGLLQGLVLRRKARDVLLSVLATTVGVALVCSIGATGPAQLEGDFMMALRTGIVGGAIGGWISGMCQCVILRRRVSRANSWILLTALGWAAGWALTGETFGVSASWSFDQQHLSSTLFTALRAVAGGAMTGLGQWLVLRHNVKRAGWWILATAVSWGIVYLSPVMYFSILGGAVVGIVTGAALVWLLSLRAT